MTKKYCTESSKISATQSKNKMTGEGWMDIELIDCNHNELNENQRENFNRKLRVNVLKEQINME